MDPFLPVHREGRIRFRVQLIEDHRFVAPVHLFQLWKDRTFFYFHRYADAPLAEIEAAVRAALKENLGCGSTS